MTRVYSEKDIDSFEESSFEEFGRRLRVHREETDLSLYEIADRTRVPLDFLEAIEKGERGRLPAEVFVKGFLRSYAREIGLNPEEVLEEYKYLSSEPAPDDVVSQLPITPKEGLGGGLRRYWQYVAWVLLIAAVAAGGYLYYPQIKSLAWDRFMDAGEKAESAPQEADVDVAAVAAEDDLYAPGAPMPDQAADQTADSSVTRALVAPAADEPAPAAEEPAPADEAATDEEATDAATTPEENPATDAAAAESADSAEPVDEAAVEEPEPAEASEPAAADAPAGGHELRLVFTDDVWLQVITDQKDKHVGLYGADMSKTFQAEKSFNIRVGNAGGVTVFLDGQKLDPLGPPGKVVQLTLPRPQD